MLNAILCDPRNLDIVSGFDSPQEKGQKWSGTAASVLPLRLNQVLSAYTVETYIMTAGNRPQRKDYMKRVMTIVFGVALMTIFGFSAMAQTPANRSYYVRADGDDENNNGRSEEAPFKTLKKAVEMATKGAVKTITVIGTLDKNSERGRSSDAIFDIAVPDSQEILITGKPDASEGVRAVLSGKSEHTHVIQISIGTKSTIRLENIEISGGNDGDHMQAGGLTVKGAGNVILGVGSKIINNKIGLLIYGGPYDKPTVTLVGCEICENTGYDGGGVYLTGGASFIINSGKISKNSTTGAGNSPGTDGGRGGGILVDGGKSLIINGGEISENTSVYGGGIFVPYSEINFQYNGGVIANNTAKKQGGGIHNYSKLFTMSGGEITGNKAAEGGGIYNKGYRIVGGPSTIDISKGTIAKNLAEYGAGIYLEEEAALTLSGGTITENTAEFVGGGIYIQTGATYTAKGGKVEKNAAGDGEGLDIFKQ
jgi:hypothetical protein